MNSPRLHLVPDSPSSVLRQQEAYAREQMDKAPTQRLRWSWQCHANATAKLIREIEESRKP